MSPDSSTERQPNKRIVRQTVMDNNKEKDKGQEDHGILKPELKELK